MSTQEPSEQVVLLAENGVRIGVTSKDLVHGHATPLHLAFSCYAFASNAELLVTRRSIHKTTFPGLWTNTCCGHPAPDESFESAIRRRADEELCLSVTDIQVALPSFRYRAEMGGIVENEICPVFLARCGAPGTVDTAEVCDLTLMPWPDFVDRALHDPGYSPWARLQVAELVRSRKVAAYLREP